MEKYIIKLFRNGWTLKSASLRNDKNEKIKEKKNNNDKDIRIRSSSKVELNEYETDP